MGLGDAVEIRTVIRTSASSYDRTCDEEEANPSITQREQAVQHPTGDVPYRFPVGGRTWGGSKRYAAPASTQKHGEQTRNT
ncbi:hypothetical protein PPTG_24650 [Phytophthora nicotianae INRA-310]|uniref:Uncharacterized protein n=1 Tax=Phytophthora nicotianae (strain INRA-310) TaxID=761204 RepID=W2PCH6_PHYN3|nr:hypothetical protein PPTG_24650 [Phytophthora nicotianae INRA-310]ETM98340.1 hypothetical protein PPTG_24650 [Phytophthora nicotianae INRA-310]